MSFVCLNGTFLPKGEAHLSIEDRGFLLGDGLFETIRVANGRPQQLARHFARFKNGLDLLHFPALDCDKMARDMCELCARVALDDAVIRLTASRGGGPRGLHPGKPCDPTWLLTIHPAATQLHPANLSIATLRKDLNSPLTRIKHSSYLPNILARLEASRNNCDDAIFLTQDGFVSETCSANLIVRFKSEFLTPPLEDGALPGVTRGRLIDAKLCREQHMTVDDLLKADAIWLSTSLSLRAVARVQGTDIPLDPRWHEKLTRLLFDDVDAM